MKTKIAIFILILIAVAAGIFYWRGDLALWYSLAQKKIAGVEEISVGSLMENISKDISLPPPLRAVQSVLQSNLTQAGTIEWTNKQRATYGLAALKENSRLDQAAMIKAQDILKNQYFEHVSPSGLGPEDLAGQVGYEYIALAENLALGNYKDDQALLQAWMDSAGHRANILNSRYSEIGVAVLKGKYEGRTTWVAVQEFGRPLAACQSPSASLKARIEDYENQAAQIFARLQSERANVDSDNFSSREEYRQAIQAYNDLVRQYNSLVNEIKSMIASYNDQVRNFNACASG